MVVGVLYRGGGAFFGFVGVWDWRGNGASEVFGFEDQLAAELDGRSQAS